MQKRIVVLGGVGLVGTHLCRRLLEEGVELYCVDTREAAASPLLRNMEKFDNFHYIHHNIVSPFNISCDEIYNLAAPALLRYNRSLPVETMKIHIEGSINALEVARVEFARIVYASSANVYSPLRRDIYTDNHSEASELLASIEGKRAAEALYQAYKTEYDVDARIARIFNAYGTGADLDDQRVVMKMVVAALQNHEITIFGSGEQIRTFCWVGDLVDGLIRLMRRATMESLRPVDLGTDREISIRALAEKIIQLTGSHSTIKHIEARHNDPRNRIPDLSVAHQDLDWSPQTTLTEGLQRTIDYAEKELSGHTFAARSWVEVN
ncbi:MAG: NAD-dependent epimerase/dehydratase family protein [Alistipes sp.]